VILVRPPQSSRRSSRAVVSLTLLLVDVLTLAFTLANLHGPVRLGLGLILGAVIPGWSVVGLLKLGQAALEVGLTVGVSLALLTVTAQVLLAVHVWHLLVLQEVTCLICIPPLVWQSFDHPKVRVHEQ
jgi:uncharacterized membrane protein